MIRTNALSVVCAGGLFMLTCAPALGVVNDDFESYTVGQTADVANPSRFTDFAGFDVGTIANGAATTNVASSQVLEHTAANTYTQINGADIVDDQTITLDFRASAGDHAIYVQDSTNALDGIFINLQNSFTAGGLRIQAFGTGNAHDSWTAGISDDWIRLTIGLHVDNADPTQSSFSISVYNITQDAVINTAGSYTGSALMFNDVPLINRVRVQTVSSGGLQVDNITATPEPASIALVALGGICALVRRR